MCNRWFRVAVKTKGTTDDEGQIGEVRECGENENDMSADHIWCLGLRSQKYESEVFLQTLTLDEFTKPTEEDSFSESLSLKSAVYRPEWNSVCVALLCIWICICHRLWLFMQHCESLINPIPLEMGFLICGSDI